VASLYLNTMHCRSIQMDLIPMRIYAEFDLKSEMLHESHATCLRQIQRVLVTFQSTQIQEIVEWTKRRDYKASNSNVSFYIRHHLDNIEQQMNSSIDQVREKHNCYYIFWKEATPLQRVKTNTITSYVGLAINGQNLIDFDHDFEFPDEDSIQLIQTNCTECAQLIKENLKQEITHALNDIIDASSSTETYRENEQCFLNALGLSFLRITKHHLNKDFIESLNIPRPIKSR
jgi:hypothetical protein